MPPSQSICPWLWLELYVLHILNQKATLHHVLILNEHQPTTREKNSTDHYMCRYNGYVKESRFYWKYITWKVSVGFLWQCVWLVSVPVIVCAEFQERKRARSETTPSTFNNAIINFVALFMRNSLLVFVWSFGNSILSSPSELAIVHE